MGSEFARLEHLAHDVTAADEFALDIELRDRRPVRVVLDALTDIGIREHVHAFEGNAKIVEDLHDLA